MTEPPTVAADEFPPFVTTPAEQYRWRLCLGVTRQIASADDPLLCRMLFMDPNIPTVTEPVQEAELTGPEREERSIAGKASAAKRRAERELEPLPPAPEPKLTPEEMAARGFDDWPEKGPMARELLGDKYDTHELHRPDGDLSHLPAERRYTEERQQQVHEPIVRGLIGEHASQAEPHVLVVAGGPASGKSTFLKSRGLALPDDAVRLNADDIAAGEGPHEGIPEARDMLDAADPYAAVAAHREAGDIFEKTEQAAVAKRTNIIMDVTGNGEAEQFQRQLKRLKDAGYKVDMLYVSTPTRQAIRHNLVRAERENRYVPTPILRNKHRRVAQNFKVVAQDGWLNSVRVYDPEHGLVAFRNEQGAMEPTHDEGYARWMAKADEKPVKEPRTPRDLREATRRESTVIGVPFELEDREAAHAEADRRASASRRKAAE